MRRNILLLSAWIGSALLIGGFIWLFTQSYRSRLLTETVNNALTANGEQLKIEAIPGFSGASVMGGNWFKVSNSANHAFVFTMTHNGLTAACVALTENGKVRTIIPLSGNARQISGELDAPVYRFYADRIERDAKNRGFR